MKKSEVVLSIFGICLILFLLGSIIVRVGEKRQQMRQLVKEKYNRTVN